MYGQQGGMNQGQIHPRMSSVQQGASIGNQNVYQSQPSSMVGSNQQRAWFQQQQQPSQQRQQQMGGPMGARAPMMRSPTQQRMSSSPRYPMGQPTNTNDPDLLLSYQQHNDLNGHPAQQQQQQQQQQQPELTPQDKLSKFADNL